MIPTAAHKSGVRWTIDQASSPPHEWPERYQRSPSTVAKLWTSYCFPYVRLRPVLVSPLTVSAKPRNYGDQVSVLRFVLFRRSECVTDIRERNVWTAAVQLNIQRIWFLRIPMLRQTHRIKLERSIALREPRECQRPSSINQIRLGLFTVAI